MIYIFRKFPLSIQNYILTITDYQQQRKSEDIDSELEEESTCKPLTIKHLMLLTETSLRITEIDKS